MNKSTNSRSNEKQEILEAAVQILYEDIDSVKALFKEFREECENEIRKGFTTNNPKGYLDSINTFSAMLKSEFPKTPMKFFKYFSKEFYPEFIALKSLFTITIIFSDEIPKYWGYKKELEKIDLEQFFKDENARRIFSLLLQETDLLLSDSSNDQYSFHINLSYNIGYLFGIIQDYDKNDQRTNAEKILLDRKIVKHFLYFLKDFLHRFQFFQELKFILETIDIKLRMVQENSYSNSAFRCSFFKIRFPELK